VFLRVDSDLFVNLDNVFSYKLSDDGDAFKLIFWGNNGNIINTVFYMKNMEAQIILLQEVIKHLRDLTINPDRSMYQSMDLEPTPQPVEEEPVPTREEHRAKRVKESISVEEEPVTIWSGPRVKESVPEGQLSIFDMEDKKED
jgi:hypothetical protein